MKRVVIVGGGFGGVSCAGALRRRLPAKDAAIVLFNRENHLVFHPLLPEVAGGSIQPDAVAAPLRQMLPGVLCRSEAVTAIDLDARTVDYVGLEGRPGNLAYDHLVLACGTQVNLASFVERLPMVLDQDTLLAEVITRFCRERLDLCCVVDGERRLCGILTRSDLLRAAELAAALPVAERASLRVSRAMVPNPLVIRTSDSSMVAAETLRDHGLKALPVVEDGDGGRLAGYVRVERFMEYVFGSKGAFDEAKSYP